MGKTGQDARRKRKPCRKVFIHISNKSASNKLKIVSIESSKLLCLNGILFCSNSCKLKTFPLSIASVLTLVVNGGLGHEASKQSMSINVKNWKNRKYYNTYRTTKGIVKVCQRNNGIEEDSLKTQQLIYAHRFAGRESAFQYHLHIKMDNMVITACYYMTDSRDRGISQSAFENPGPYIPIRTTHTDRLIRTDISSQQNY